MSEAPNTRGTNPRGIELKAEVRRKLAEAQAAAVDWSKRYDEAIARIDRDVLEAHVKGSAFGLIVGVLLAWWTL